MGDIFKILPLNIPEVTDLIMKSFRKLYSS